jgi:hypothetical protein
MAHYFNSFTDGLTPRYVAIQGDAGVHETKQVLERSEERRVAGAHVLDAACQPTLAQVCVAMELYDERAGERRETAERHP